MREFQINRKAASAFLLSGCLFMSALGYEQSARSGNFPPISTASFIYHPKSKALLLVGSVPTYPDKSQSNVWKWDGSKWTEIKSFGPGSRDFFTAALDTKNGMVYAFGGIGSFNEEREGDLWTFNGERWSKVTSNDIGTRDHHCMVYADHLDAFVVYGGQSGDRSFDTTTWLLKDDKFIPLHIPGPGIRYHAAMTYDKRRKKVVLYGGGERANELWEFDGTAWTQIVTKENPGKKLYHFMVYDDDLEMVVLHGGWRNQDFRDLANKVTPITWGWDGREWRKLAEERIFPVAMGYDPNRKVIVAFGRDNESPDAEVGLWEFTNGNWIKKATYRKASANNH